MDILHFTSRNGYFEVTVKTTDNPLPLWQMFKERADVEHQEDGAISASTYCKYSSKTAGTLSLLRYDVDPELQGKLLTIDSTEDAESWDGLPPVLFETGGSYRFEIFFHNIKGRPCIIHELRDVSEAFEWYAKEGVLTGNLNFLNQPGTFPLEFEFVDDKNIRHQEKLSLEVVSPKLDTKRDLSAIKQLIDEEYEEYVYQYLSMTYQNQKIKPTDRNSDDVWLSIFKQIVDKYLQSIKYIIRHSHHKSVSHIIYSRPDNIDFWEEDEAERWAEMTYRPDSSGNLVVSSGDAENSYFRTRVFEHTIDTKENRFVKHTLISIEKKLMKTFSNIQTKYADKLSEEFKKQIEQYRETFDKYIHSKFFRAIGKYSGSMQESLVLQQRMGYRNVYVCWQMLRSAINLEEGGTQIGMKQISRLYEVWCFLIMKRLVCKVLDLDTHDRVHVVPFGSSMSECIEDQEKQTGYHFYLTDDTENGDFIDLTYQKSYRFSSPGSGMYSMTVKQIPDIVMDIHRGKDVLTYLYDAKYRVKDDCSSGTDDPVPDTINDMHHYRDSIYSGYVEETLSDGNTIKRPAGRQAIGGYILFPGRVKSEEDLESKYFIKSINAINIGAFPLLPSKTTEEMLDCPKLENHLKYILGKPDIYDHVKNSIPQQGMKYITQ